jgi:hypothetical protein
LGPVTVTLPLVPFGNPLTLTAMAPVLSAYCTGKASVSPASTVWS